MMDRRWNAPRTTALALAGLVIASTASPASAQSPQGAAGLARPTPRAIAPLTPATRPGELRAPAPPQELAASDPEPSPPTDAEASEPTEPEPARASGPRIELGYALYSLSDGESSGRVNAGSFGGYFHTGALRLGAYAELGKRADRFGVDDVTVRAVAIAGYQYRLRWLVPYVAVVASYGWLIEQGAGAPRSAALPGAGLELGVDLRLGAVFVGVSSAWTRILLRGETQDLFLLRFRVGV